MAQDSAAFDPYYYFLGISPKDGPLDHYRLLGVESFESNTEIIEMAADRQMGHLQRHESGDHIDAVAELLGEVSRARLCLLNTDKKEVYDRDLRATLEAPKKAPPLPAPKQEPLTAEVVDDAIVLDGRSTAANALPAPAAARPPRPAQQPVYAEAAEAPRRGEGGRPLLIAGLVTLAVLFVLLAVGGILLAVGISSDGDDEVSAEAEPASEQKAYKQDVDRTPTSTPASIPQTNLVRPDTPVTPAQPEVELAPIKIIRIEPEAPMEGDHISIWLDTNIQPEVGIEYRKSTTSYWTPHIPPGRTTSSRTMRPPTSPLNQVGTDDAPPVIVANVQLGTLQLEFRAVDAQRNYSAVTAKDIPVKLNPWKSWRETVAITHTQPVVSLAFSADGEAILALAATTGTSSSSRLQNAVSQMTVWKTSDLSLESDTNRLETLGAALRDDLTLVEICQTFDPSSAGSAVQPAGFSSTSPTDSGVYTVYAIVGGQQIQLDSRAFPVQGIGLSPKADRVAIDVSGTVQVWDLPARADEPASDSPIAEFSAPASLGPAGSTASYRNSPTGLQAGVLEFSPDGELLCRRGSNVQVWRVADQRLVCTFDDAATSVAFSSDAQLLAVATTDGIRIYKTSDRQLVRTLPIGGSISKTSRSSIRYGRVISPPRRVIIGEIADMCFDHSDEVLAVANSSRIYVVRASDGHVLQELSAYGMATSLEFRPDGESLVCASSDRTVRVFAPSTSSSERISAPPHEPGRYLLIDKLIAAGEYGPALDAMSIESILSTTTRYTLLRSYNYKLGEAFSAKDWKVVHTALADATESRLDAKLVERFRSIRTKLQEEHRQLVAKDLETAAAASGQAQLDANFIIYRDYPSELLPKTFVDQQEKLQENRKADALKSLDLATKYVRSGKVTLKSHARKEFQKVMDMKLFLPVEAAQAENLMRSYRLITN